jgi:hypothetical protein
MQIWQIGSEANCRVIRHKQFLKSELDSLYSKTHIHKSVPIKYNKIERGYKLQFFFFFLTDNSKILQSAHYTQKL